MTRKKRYMTNSTSGGSREEGAVMLVVMLLLLMTTSTAVFAAHSTTSELRASGHMRQSMQTEYLGETGVTASMAWIDRIHPQKVKRWIEKDIPVPMDAFGGPEYDPTRAHRRVAENFRFEIPVADGDSLGGSAQPYTPILMIDLYDYSTYSATLPGYRSDGYGRLKFMEVTYTSRGRARPVGVDGDYAPHRLETASDARAHGISGPFAD